MFDAATIEQVSRLAAAFDDEKRLDEASGYHKALCEALNATHINGEQDALCVFEAMGLMLAQLVAGMAEPYRSGSIAYVAVRAQTLAPLFSAAGKGAAHRVEAS